MTEKGISVTYALPFLKSLPADQLESWKQSSNPDLICGVLAHAMRETGSFDAALQMLGLEAKRIDLIRVAMSRGLAVVLTPEMVKQFFPAHKVEMDAPLPRRIAAISLESDIAFVEQTVKDVIASGNGSETFCRRLLGFKDRLHELKKLDGFEAFILNMVNGPMDKILTLSLAVAIKCEKDQLRAVFDSQLQRQRSKQWPELYTIFLEFDSSEAAIERVRKLIGPKGDGDQNAFYHWLLDIKAGKQAGGIPMQGLGEVVALDNANAVYQFMIAHKSEFSHLVDDLLSWDMLQHIPLTARRFNLYVYINTVLALRLK